MIDIWTVFSAVMPAYVLVACGAWLRRAEWLTHEADESLLRVVVNVLTPCLILDNVMSNEALRRPGNLWLPPLAGFAGVAVGLWVAGRVARWAGTRTEAERRTFVATAGFQNYGYAPLPLITLLFPRETTGVLFLHNLGVDVALWTLGLVAFGHAGWREWRKLLSPPLVAVLGGVALNLAGVRFPAFVGSAVHMLGVSCFPLGLMLIGATLYEAMPRWRDAGGARLMAASCVARCAVAPALMLAIARWLPASVELKRVLVVEAAMPAAVFPIVMARHYGGDVPTSVRVVVATSALGFLTIPLWVRMGLEWVPGASGVPNIPGFP